MRFFLVFEPEAKLEFDEAHDYYELAQKGLGKKFRLAVRESLSRIRRTPLSRGVIYPPDVRRVLVSKYPYAVMYRVKSNNQIRVVSVFHSSRNPLIWQKRADDLGEN